MGVRCTGNHVHHIAVPGKNAGQRSNDIFDALVRREQAKRQQDVFPFSAKPIFIERRIGERQIGECRVESDRFCRSKRETSPEGCPRTAGS